MKVAYLGPAGTFGEAAALQYAPDAELLPLPSHAGVAAAVASHMADEAVLPVENSVEGSVNETLDILIHDSDLRIRAELVVAIEQCLLVRPGMAPADVRVIYSHPQALGQCRGFIERCFPKARLEASLSTAAAVQEIFAHDDAAAIASARAAELHGAAILARGIGDRRSNVTRFVVLAAADALPTGHDKTSLAFTTRHDRPGTLVGILNELADRGVNMTKIESRPSKDALGVYVFLVDFEGHRAEPKIAETIEAIRAQANWLKVFGSFPRYAE
ncbi:MAG: prephenate dehydratase [Dehalococcoidia bacterium]